MKIIISDDFNLEKIINSGQCFRAEQLENNLFQFITRDNILRIKQLGENLYDFSCEEYEYLNIWIKYFDFLRDYKTIIKKNDNSFINKAIDYGRGIRILQQDPWETLISFIISQNKNIPAIKKSIKILSKEYGHPIYFQDKIFYSFPTPEELSIVTESDLNRLSLGYRSKYIIDAVNKVNSGKIELFNLETSSDQELIKKLMEIKGVGPKVAHCVGLFAYGRVGMVPQDVWIKRTIKEEFKGVNLFETLGETAGIIQQYIFYYQRNK